MVYYNYSILGGGDVLKSIPVAMPEKKITYKSGKNGTVYVYYTLRAYRNENGKPTSDEVAIGKKDIVTGNLIPNRKYFEIFTPEQSCPAPPKSAQSCGNIQAMMKVSESLELTETLKKCFPDKWDKLLAVAFYILCEGNVMMYIEDWFDETDVGFTKRMNDVDSGKLFASITDEDRNTFFIEWVKLRNEKEYIAYDVSSISTYSRNIERAEWGYNRDGENIPQLNLGMYYGMTTQVPVYYDLYSGSIPDKTYFEHMMTASRDLGITNVCFVIDGGFITSGNLAYIHKNKVSFISAFPGNRLETLRIIDEAKGSIRKSANRISEFEVYGVKKSILLDGVSVEAHIYFDPEKQALDEKELYARIDRLQAELGKMSRTKRLTKRYKDYFNIEERQKDEFVYEINGTKIDVQLERAGFFVLLSNKPDLSSAEVLKLYRTRDIVEKNFDQLKNRLDFNRMRTHWSSTTEGKMFVGFLALILRSEMLRRVKQSDLTKRFTFDKILLELKKIKSVTFSDSSKALIPLTKVQKNILSVLDTSTEMLN